MTKTRRRKKKINHPERDMQARVFEECKYREGRYPDLEDLYAIPNGQYRPGFALEPGTKAGMPDIHLPVARGGFLSFYIELKMPGEEPSDTQLKVHKRLRAQGHRVDVYWSDTTAIAALCAYLKQPRTEIAQ